MKGGGKGEKKSGRETPSDQQVEITLCIKRTQQQSLGEKLFLREKKSHGAPSEPEKGVRPSKGRTQGTIISNKGICGRGGKKNRGEGGGGRPIYGGQAWCQQSATGRKLEDRAMELDLKILEKETTA